MSARRRYDGGRPIGRLRDERTPGHSAHRLLARGAAGHRSAGNARVARSARRDRRRAGRRTRHLRAAPVVGTRAPAPRAPAARAQLAVPEHDRPRAAAGVSGRPRDRGAPLRIGALERAGDGRARESRAPRPGRPHRELRVGGRPVRSRLQPLLPRRAGRRPRLLPAALRAGRVRARVSRRAPVRDAPRELPPRSRRRGPLVVSASVADARLLAVPDRLDGHRADQRDLPGALHALSRRPRSRRYRGAQGVGIRRRRRDGRARVAGGTVARRARRPRQPDLRRQLQPAAPRRPGARQRLDRAGTRRPLRRRRLERDQAPVELRLGSAVRARHRRRAVEAPARDGRRRVPDVRRHRRRDEPRTLLQPLSRARSAGRADVRRRHRPPAPRRPRSGEDPRRVSRGGRSIAASRR